MHPIEVFMGFATQCGHAHVVVYCASCQLTLASLYQILQSANLKP